MTTAQPDDDRARLHQLLSRLTRAAAGHADSSVRSPQDMTRAWAVVDVHQRASAALTALALVRVFARADAAERDLAALRQERDDWRQAFEAANEAIGTMEASHAQALQRARVEYRTFFEAGWSRGFQEALTEDTRPWEDRCEAELTAYLASRKG